MKRITDPTFSYTPAVSTDIRKTFARERKRLAEAKATESDTHKVLPMVKARK